MPGAFTDLEQIKNRARTLVYADYKIEEKYGLLVQHPYFSTVLDGVQENGKVELVDIRVPEQLEKLRKLILKSIDAVTSYSQFIMLVRTPYLPVFFKLTNRFLSLYDFSVSLATIWTLVEFPNLDVNVSKNEFIRYFKMCRKDYLMDKEEYKAYKELPDEITVYRGVNSVGRILSLSWTTDLETAKWFAKRWTKDGKVCKGKIKKEYVLAYFLGRGESEVIIEFNKLTDVEEVPF